MLYLLFLLPIQEEPVERLIERLGSNSVEEREGATRALEARRDDAEEELEKAARDPDPEVAGRAREILLAPSPHRLEVQGEIAHLFEHALESFEARRAAECSALCEAMLLVDPRCRPALALKEALERGSAEAPPAGDLTPLRVPSRRAWEGLRQRIRDSALLGIDTPLDGSQCPTAVRCRLETLRIDLEFENATLGDVIDLLRDLTGLAMVLDARAVPFSDMDRKLTYQARGRSVGQSLREILRESGQGYVVTPEGVVLIGPPQTSPGAGPSRAPVRISERR